MKTLCLPFLAAMCLVLAARGDDVLPQPAPAKRYDTLSAHSPFAPPTGPVAAPVATPPPPPAPAWSDNLTITSLMQTGNVYTATVVEKDTSLRYLIRSDRENPDNQLRLASVNWADKPDAIKVTVAKGTQFGDVHFDPAAATSPGGLGSGLPPGTIRPPAPPANFHPPPGVAATLPNPPGGQPLNTVRGRPVIRAAPPPVTAPAARPVITAPGLPNRPVNKAANDDDDDDD